MQTSMLSVNNDIFPKLNNILYMVNEIQYDLFGTISCSPVIGKQPSSNHLLCYTSTGYLSHHRIKFFLSIVSVETTLKYIIGNQSDRPCEKDSQSSALLVSELRLFIPLSSRDGFFALLTSGTVLSVIVSESFTCKGKTCR